MRKTLLFLTTGLSIASLHCTKKQFLPFDQPHEVMQVKAKGQIEILQEPMKKEMILWDSTKVQKLPVEGILRVTYKDVDYFYLQLNCPQELKCNGKKAYIPRNLTHAVASNSIPFSREFTEPADIVESARFIVAPASSMAGLIEFQDWVAADVKNEVPVLFDAVIFRANIPENRKQFYSNLYFFAKSLREGLPGHLPPQIARQFPKMANAIATGSRYSLSHNEDAFIWALHNAVEGEAREILRQEVEGFPFAHANYKAMASAFNTAREPVMLRATLASRILEGTQYALVNPVAAATATGAAVPPMAEGAVPQTAAVQISATATVKDGLHLKYSADGIEKEINVPEELITARPHPKGITFVIGKDTPEQLIFEPIAEPNFLKSGSSAEIQKFVKAIPDYKKFIQEYDFDQALLRIAMKYGKGDLNRKTAQFEYEIDLSQNRNFWIVLAAIKRRFEEDSEDKFSGEVPDKYGPLGDASERKGSINWYQKYDKATKEASMGIKGKATYCQRHCEDLEVDMVCLQNQGTLKVKFRPAALYASPKDPDYWQYSKFVHADFPENEGETSCNTYFKLRRTNEKFL